MYYLNNMIYIETLFYFLSLIFIECKPQQHKYYIFSSALLLGILKIMYSSKCSKINCCFGAVDIIRDIESEVEEDKYKIDHPQSNNNIPSLNIV